MTLRLIEIIIASSDMEDTCNALAEHDIKDYWHYTIDEDKSVLKCLTAMEDTEALMEVLEEKFGKKDTFRMVFVPVEASIPRIKSKREKEKESEKMIAEKDGAVSKKKQENNHHIIRINREELYNDVLSISDLSLNYIVLIMLSAIVAGIGILQDQVAVIIGAMVIAPMLGPNVGQALGTTLGDIPLMKKAAITNLSGVGLVLLIGILWGIVIGDLSQINTPTIGFSSIVLALASGAAGVFSMLTGTSSAIVGVMVAVALLPPLVTTGLFLGEQNWANAGLSFVIFLTNIMGINLAGILTFLLAGVRPGSWWEEKKAKKNTKIALVTWSILLILLLLFLFLYTGKSHYLIY